MTDHVYFKDENDDFYPLILKVAPTLNYIVKLMDMKTSKLYLISGLLIYAMVFFGCRKEEPSKVSFKMKALENQSQNMKSSASTTELGLTWDTAWIIVSKLEFEAKFRENTAEENISMIVNYQWEGNKMIDLLAEPEVFALIELPDGTYDEIELKVQSKEQSNPDQPNFYLTGNLTEKLEVFPIVLIISEDLEIETEVEDWIIQTENTNFFTGMIEISLQKLFDDITVLELTSAVMIDGRIIITSEINANLYEKILENLSTNMECDGDEDDDDD